MSDDAKDLNVGERAAHGIRRAVGKTFGGIGAIIFGFVVVLTRPVPFLGTKFWGKMATKSLYQYHKSHGGDRTGLEATPSNDLKLTPVKWKGASAVDEDERPGWHAKGRDKVWKPTTLGQTGPRLGKTPIVTLDTESWRSTSVLEARVAEAIDMGDMRPLYRVDEANLTATVDLGPQGGQGAAAPALADGGEVQSIQFEPRSSPIFEDMIIDLGSENYDGQAVSFWKAKELMGEQTTSEEMENQEKRGFLAGRSKENMMKWMFRIMLIAGLVALGGLIGPELIAAFFGGGGGGGGGGMIPI